MNLFFECVLQHAEHAHWFFFGATLLAGINLPISIDLLMIFASFLAATVIPEHLWHLYFAMFLGCYLSACLIYWTGRVLDKKLKKYKWFNRIASQERVEKIKNFYLKHGFWTLLVGRFIPFGVRNCIFISTGLSRLSFIKFALWDFIACFIWSSLLFYLFFTFGKNYSMLLSCSGTLSIIIILIFSAAVIGFIWYYRRKKRVSSKSYGGQ